MNISSTTNLTEVKFDTSQALGIKNVNIKEEKKSAAEITFIPWEDMDYEKCIGKDGKKFEVVSYYKVKGETLNKDYLDVFSSKAQGKDVKCYDYYVKNFLAKITKNFSDSGSLKNDEESLKKGIDDLVGEMKKNISKGISNNIENLNTKFNVNGVDFTLKELMDSSKVMDYANSILRTTGSGLNYENYAEMGIAKGKVNTYAEKNLNTDQQKLLNSTMSARIQKIIDSVPEKVDETYKKGIVVDKNNKFYAIKNVQAATNIEYAKEIMDTFANVDYSNIESFEKATEIYRNLIKPVLESAGVINIGRNQALTDTTNYEINKFKSLFDESYKRVFLSAAEVRKMFGNSKNVIDICR
ncbi:hypothetical protein [Clostridium lundense]|uniref:hypothetical protein n=1 Tax=Clostridium lundense TaxID=319475 RepID=UPI0004886C89|nr:hypothetical protein [Clostridium lundense]